VRTCAVGNSGRGRCERKQKTVTFLELRSKLDERHRSLGGKVKLAETDNIFFILIFKTFFFFFFFDISAQEGEEGFELVTTTSLKVVPTD
jgi:hypothetical protein